MSKIQIHIQPPARTFECEAAPGSLLQHIEAQELVVRHSCRAGHCGACRATLVHGRVRLIIQPLFKVKEGEILTCCCQPASSILKLSFEYPLRSIHD